MRRLLAFGVLTAWLVAGCGDADDPASSTRSTACSVTDLFPASLTDPRPLADQSAAAVERTGAFAGGERELVLALAAVAESSSNAVKIQKAAGSGWETTVAGERVIARLRDDEDRLTAACRAGG